MDLSPIPQPEDEDEEEQVTMTPIEDEETEEDMVIDAEQVSATEEEEEEEREEENTAIVRTRTSFARISFAGTDDAVPMTRSGAVVAVSSAGRTRQKRLGLKGHCESPVERPLPSTRAPHQVAVLTFPQRFLKDPCASVVDFRDSITSQASQEMFKLLVLLSAIVAQVSISEEEDEDDDEPEEAEEAQPSRRGRAKPKTPKANHMCADRKTSRVCCYIEYLSAKQDCEEEEETTEEREHKFAGMRVWLFLMEPRLDLGALLTTALSNSGYAWQATDKPTSKNERKEAVTKFRDSISRSEEDLLGLPLITYLSSPTRDRLIARRLEILSSSETAAQEKISDTASPFHPSSLFSIRTAMLLHTAEVCHEQKRESSYVREDGKFKGFPFPRLVAYVPSHVFSSPTKLSNLPILNDYLDALERRKVELRTRFRQTAFFDDSLSLTSGFTELTMAMIDESRKDSLLYGLLAEHETIYRRLVEEVMPECSSISARHRALTELSVATNKWPLYERSDLLKMRLFLMNVISWMNNNIPRWNPHYNAYVILRQRKAVDEFYELFMNGTVPGPYAEMRSWWKALSPEQQLPEIPHSMEDLSSYGNLKSYLYWVYERVLGIYTNHALLYKLHLTLLASAEFNDWKMPTHHQLTGNPGGGKSEALNSLQKLAAPGKIQTVSHATPQAFSVDDDKLADRLVLWHDAPSFLRGDSSKRGEKNAGGSDGGTQTYASALVTAMTETTIESFEFKMDREKGEPRQNVKSVARFTSSLIYANNDPVQGPVEDRSHTTMVAKTRRADHESGMLVGNSSGFDFLREDPIHAAILHDMRALDFLCACVYKAQESLAIHRASEFVLDVFVQRIKKVLYKNFKMEVRERSVMRLRNLSVAATTMTAVYKTLLSDVAKYRWREDRETGTYRGFDPVSLLFVQQHLVVTEEIVADIFSLLISEFLPLSAYAIAQTVAKGFSLEDPSRGGHHCRRFVDLNDQEDPEYVCMRYVEAQTPRVIDQEMDQDLRIGSNNVKQTLQRMRSMMILSHPYAYEHPSEAYPSGRLVEQTHARKRHVPLVKFEKGKERVNMKRELYYLLVHVSMANLDLSQVTENVIREVFEYNHTLPEQRIVTSIPLKVPPEEEDRNEAASSSTSVPSSCLSMPHLFQTIDLHANENEEIFVGNSHAYQETDRIRVLPIRRRLQRMRGYHVDEQLDAIRQTPVFSLEHNAEQWATKVHLGECGIRTDTYHDEAFDEHFVLVNKAYREAHSDLYPPEERCEYSAHSDETRKKIESLSSATLRVSNNNQLSSTNRRPPPLSSVVSFQNQGLLEASSSREDCLERGQQRHAQRRSLFSASIERRRARAEARSPLSRPRLRLFADS